MAIEETIPLQKVVNSREGGDRFCLISAIGWIGEEVEKGHFISYIKDNKGQWWKANDQHVNK